MQRADVVEAAGLVEAVHERPFGHGLAFEVVSCDVVGDRTVIPDPGDCVAGLDRERFRRECHVLECHGGPVSHALSASPTRLTIAATMNLLCVMDAPLLNSCLVTSTTETR